MEPETVKVVIEKKSDGLEVKGRYTKQELRKLLLSSISLQNIGNDDIEETLKETGLSRLDLEKLRYGKAEELSEDAVEKLKELEITEEMVAGSLTKSEEKFGELFDEIDKSEKFDELGIKDEREIEVNPGEEIEGFLRGRGLSESLIKSLLAAGLSDEFIRLLKALGLTDEDIAKLQNLWNIKSSTELVDDSFASSTSSSDQYLSPDGLYLKSSLSKPLTNALREIVTKKPGDPVEYLGHWLLYYKVCEERVKKQKEFQLELMIERERLKMLQGKDEALESLKSQDGEEYAQDWNYLNYEGL